MNPFPPPEVHEEMFSKTKADDNTVTTPPRVAPLPRHHVTTTIPCGTNNNRRRHQDSLCGRENALKRDLRAAHPRPGDRSQLGFTRRCVRAMCDGGARARVCARTREGEYPVRTEA